MTDVAEHRAYPTEAEVALLASAAALELDRRLRGAESDLQHVVDLVGVLRGRLQPSSERLLDPMTAEFFRRALTGPTERSLTALQSEVEKFLRRLAEAIEKPTLDLADLRDRCVALSQSAQASAQAFREDRSEHRYQR